MVRQGGNGRFGHVLIPLVRRHAERHGGPCLVDGYVHSKERCRICALESAQMAARIGNGDCRGESARCAGAAGLCQQCLRGFQADRGRADDLRCHVHARC